MTIDHAQIYSFLWIGDRFTARDKLFLRNKNIGLIINASDYSNGKIINSKQSTILGINVVQIILRDDISPEENEEKWKCIKTTLNVVEIIKRFRKDNQDMNVLIHCTVGVNRSAFIIGAYLVNEFHFTFRKAIRYLQKANSLRDVPLFYNPIFFELLHSLTEKQ
jgi:protein-tyrosine phosphatase